MTSSLRSTTLALATIVLLTSALAGCSNGVPLGPSDAAARAGAATPTTPTPAPTPAPPTPGPPPPTTPTAVAYTDLVPIFTFDCTPCHGARSPAGRYSTASYAGVMAAVNPGSASSPLVIGTQPGGLMYGFLSGDRAGQAVLIRAWVLGGAPQSR